MSGRCQECGYRRGDFCGRNTYPHENPLITCFVPMGCLGIDDEKKYENKQRFEEVV